jgi:hypothetical protein
MHILTTLFLSSLRIQPTLVYTETDEAPALATYSLLPIVATYAGKVHICVFKYIYLLPCTYPPLSMYLCTYPPFSMYLCTYPLFLCTYAPTNPLFLCIYAIT